VNQTFHGWKAVSNQLDAKAEKQRSIANKQGEEATYLNKGQRASLVALGKRIPSNGIVIADEVGMGKTRIAVELARAVISCGGRVAILIPPGLGYQWQSELQSGGVPNVPSILRSISGYLDAWSEENDLLPWFETRAVLISHAFANWRMSDSSPTWRWALVPELYAQWRSRCGSNLPRGYWHSEELEYVECADAAKSIIDSISSKRSPTGKMLDKLGDEPWPSTTDASNYLKNGGLRDWLARCIGIGLGRFDLVIIDEAHKSRKTGSGLSRLLDRVLMTDHESRRVGLTATPVELGIEQWSETLARIGLSPTQLQETQVASERYANAVDRIRSSWKSSPEALEEFGNASEQFESALSPFLIRRNKREDLDVRQFKEHSGLLYHEYRREEEVTVDTSSLSSSWKVAICAAEALSVVTRQADDPIAKRLRLTLGNGHGISAVLDQLQRDEREDATQEKVSQQAATAPTSRSVKATENKRKARAEWWMGAISSAFDSEDRLLFNHPAILKAVETIESETSDQRKVLVFGRFTRPMRALVNLLNAREMLRRLETGQPWPQAKVHGTKTGEHEESEWPAVRAAHSQLSCSIPVSKIDSRLQRAYSQTQNQRKKFRDSILNLIETGLKQLEIDYSSNQMFIAFRQSVIEPKDSNVNSLTVLSRAILSLHGSTQGLFSPVKCAQAFVELITAASDRDDPDSGDDSDEQDIADRWETILERLTLEYNRPEGGFARLMYGGTAQGSRRMIQLAFNRPGSFPRVLVAQSLIGREGLNLHESCRIVVLLHPEWNPAMAEQQIGRVDRVNSLWCRELRNAISENTDASSLPRIEIRAIVFSGTYDELNWEVLKKRWDDLRAQLHGIVIPPSEMPIDDEGQNIMSEISRLTPTFFPPEDW